MAKRRTPADLTRWQDPDKRGECLCRATDPDAIRLLRAKGLDGIVYKNSDPDFTPAAVDQVDIPHMTTHRNNSGKLDPHEHIPETDPDENGNDHYLARLFGAYDFLGNFTQADRVLAVRWTKEGRGGRKWTSKDIRAYRQKNKLIWHECREPRGQMQLVPACIHRNFAHDGAVSFLHKIQDILDSITEEAWPDYPSAQRDDNEGYCPLQLILTVGFALLMLGTLLSVGGRLLDKIFWAIGTFAPFAGLVWLCLKTDGIPKKLRTPAAGITALIALIALLCLVPALTGLMFLAYLVLGIILIVKGLGRFGPAGILTITRKNADGTSTTETEAVWGDMDAAKANAENRLEREGYKVEKD